MNFALNMMNFGRATRSVRFWPRFHHVVSFSSTFVTFSITLSIILALFPSFCHFFHHFCHFFPINCPIILSLFPSCCLRRLLEAGPPRGEDRGSPAARLRSGGALEGGRQARQDVHDVREDLQAHPGEHQREHGDRQPDEAGGGDTTVVEKTLEGSQLTRW